VADHGQGRWSDLVVDNSGHKRLSGGGTPASEGVGEGSSGGCAGIESRLERGE
jgi:hypothetical protein